MHISISNNIAFSSWAIASTPSNDAALLPGSSYDYLTDGKVSKPARFTWDTGVQNNTRAIQITATFSPGIAMSVGDKFAVALLFPKTTYAPPAGTFVVVSVNNSGHSQLVGFGNPTVQFNSGATGLYSLQACSQAGTATEVQIIIKNSVSPSLTTWAAAGQTFDIGEVWFGAAHEFKNVGDPQFELKGGPTERRSHNNTNQPLYGPNPFKSWTFNFAPMDNTSAYDSTSADSFDKVRYDLTQASAAVVLPRVYTPGTTTIDTVATNQLACFGRPDSIGPLKAVRNSSGLWTASMVFSEAPP